MSDNSPTDSGNDQSSSGSREDGNNEPLLEQGADQSAEEQHDTVSGEQSQGTGQGTDDGTPDESGTSDDSSSQASSDDDDGLAKFAKAQGFDPDNLTDGEKKALKLAHDNQKAYRKTAEQKSDKTREAVIDVQNLDAEELDEIDPDDQWKARMEANQARIDRSIALQDFYSRNPEARDYDEEMGKIIAEERDTNGKAAARYLAANFDRLYILAKARRESVDTEAAREAGRREERDLQRQRQEAGANNSHASSSGNRGSKKITAEWVENEYDPSNAEHRELLDAAMARGDLY